jgi:two-component sensor histidine kinase/PAS domain-containing protein
MRLQTKIALTVLPLTAIAIIFMGVWSVITVRDSMEKTFQQLMVQELESFVDHNIRAYYDILKKNQLDTIDSFVKTYQKKVYDDTYKLHFIESGNLIIMSRSGDLYKQTADGKKFDSQVYQNIAMKITKDEMEYQIGHMDTPQLNQIYAGYFFKPWDWVIIYTVSHDIIHEAQNKIGNTAIAVGTGCLILISVLMAFVFRSFFVRPVKYLQETAQMIAEFKDVSHINIHSKDELDALARSMESMALSIKTYREKQENWQIFLESEIKRNTADLKKTNTTLENEIDTRKTIESDLRQSEERISEALDLNQKIIFASSLGILVYKKDGNCLLTNTASCKIVGATQEQVLAQNFNLTPSWKKTGLTEIANATLMDGIPRQFEMEAISSFNTPVLLDIRLTQFMLTGEPHLLMILDDILERKLLEEQIQSSLSEKEILLKEIHHRVKNNLQVVSSILKMQSKQVNDELSIKIFKESQDRITSMALVHEQLYRSDNLAAINFGDYIKELIHSLQYSFGSSINRIHINIETQDQFLGVDTAIPCGLVINELITNAYKYAFLPDEKGEISISFCLTEENKANLVVKDTGKGMPKDFDIEETKTLGMKLVYNLITHQLDGDIRVVSGPGTTIEISFPYSDKKEKQRILA